MTQLETNPQEIKTACGGTITDPDRYPSVEYEGRTVYFCTKACLRVFRENPRAFMAGEIDHPLDED